MRNPTRIVTFLALVTILEYIAFAIWMVLSRGIFEYIGVDYRLWYATGMIARFHGFDQIYYYSLQAQYQLPLYIQYAHIGLMSMPFWALPLPYLSAFTIPMVLLTFVNPVTGFVAWTVISVVGTLVYVGFFLKRNQITIERHSLLIIAGSTPFLFNVLLGQVNLWLMIALGEAMIAYSHKHTFWAGFWLAGLLLKPQLLLLLVPLILITRNWKVLAGFTAGSALVGGISFTISGMAAIEGPINTLRSWPSSLNDSGMNILTFVTNLQKFIPQNLAWVLVVLMFIFTIMLYIKWMLSNMNSGATARMELYLLVTLAVTCSISPHSNIYMALPMLLPGMVALAKRQIPRWLALTWALAPSTVFLLIAPLSVGGAHAMLGTTMLLVNLSLLFWVDLKGRAEFTTKLQEPEREGDS